MKIRLVLAAVVATSLAVPGCFYEKSEDDKETPVVYPTLHQAESSELYSYAVVSEHLIPELRNLNLPDYVREVLAKNFEGTKKRDLDLIRERVSVSGDEISLSGDVFFSFGSPGIANIITNGYRLGVAGNDWSKVSVKVGYLEGVRSSDKAEITVKAVKPPKLEQQLGADGLSLVDGSDGQDAELGERCDRLLSAELLRLGKEEATCDEAKDHFGGKNLDIAISAIESFHDLPIDPGTEPLSSFVSYVNGDSSIFECDGCYIADSDPDRFSGGQPTTQLVDEFRVKEPVGLVSTETQSFHFVANGESSALPLLDRSVVYGLEDISDWAREQCAAIFKEESGGGTLPLNSETRFTGGTRNEGADISRTGEYGAEVVSGISAVAKGKAVSRSLVTLVSGEEKPVFNKGAESWSLLPELSQQLAPTYEGIILEGESAENPKQAPKVDIWSAQGLDEWSLVNYDPLIGKPAQDGNFLEIDFEAGLVHASCEGCDLSETDSGWQLSYVSEAGAAASGDPVEVTYSKGKIVGTYKLEATDYNEVSGVVERVKP